MSPPFGSSRVPVGILGATGMVGQRLVRWLAGHPWFEVREVGASERSAGRAYGEAATWRLPGEMPPSVGTLCVKDVRDAWESPVLFSALDATVAGPLEEELARRGHLVSSNARSHRMDSDVPLLIPEVNAEHLALLDVQRERWPGALITNPNCSAIGLTMVLAPLHRAFGLTAVHVVTLQAISGAGYPGAPAYDLADNVVPFIAGEAEKLAVEPPRILGRLAAGSIDPAPFSVSAQVHRVPVSEGHQLAVSVGLATKASRDAVAEALSTFCGPPQTLGLPSAPQRPIHLFDRPDRPQPRLDRDRERGMAVVAGRLEPCPVLDFRFSALVHNTIRGAAGAAVLNAEMCYAERRLPAPA